MERVERVYSSFGSLQEAILRHQMYEVLDAIFAVLNAPTERARMRVVFGGP